jgi:hypothetical protein
MSTLLFLLSFAHATPDADDTATWRVVQASLDAAYPLSNAPVVRVEDDQAWVTGWVADESERHRVLRIVRTEAPHLAIQDGLVVGEPNAVEDLMADDHIERQLEDLDIDGEVEVEVEDGVARADGTVVEELEARVVHDVLASAPDVQAAVTAVQVTGGGYSSPEFETEQAIRAAIFRSGAECLNPAIDVADEVTTVRCRIAKPRDARQLRHTFDKADLDAVRLDLRWMR